MILFSDPYAPDGDEARALAQGELARPEYEAAKPNAFDRWALEVQRVIERLLNPEVGETGSRIGLIVLILVIVAVIVIAIVLWGRPRLAARRGQHTGELLGAPDDRTAARLRSDADRAAAVGDFATAVVLRYRALARGLVERDLIAPAPGATAQTIAREGAALFPAEQGGLQDAASTFDGVRYQGLAATEAHYAVLASVDARLAASRPFEASVLTSSGLHAAVPG